MTARVDLTEFLTAYLAEVDEQIIVANARALVIEASQRKGEKNPRAVRDLFRALHTIKGLSAMVGVEPVVAIAHRMEAVLRAADKAEGALAAPALEPLIEGLRAIEVRVRALANEKPVPLPPTALLEALDALEAGDAPGGGASRAPTLDLESSLAAKLAAFEKQQLLQGVAAGRRAVQLRFVPSAERAAAGQSISTVRERLAPLAEIVKVIPVALKTSHEAPGGLAFALLLVTAADDAALAEAAGVEVEAVKEIGLKGAPREAAEIDPLGPDVPLAPLGALAPAARVTDDPELPEEQPERSNVLRVDVSRVDDAMEKLSALIVSRSRLARAVSQLSAASPEARELKQIGSDLARQLRDLRSSILNVRMVRVRETLERIPLVVRGLRRATGKHVRLEMDVGEAELDKAVAEHIFPAILHLVRNAVDHGIETPDERRAAGKPEEGLIRITTSSRSNTQLELLVSDDGRGIDATRVAARARADVPTSDAALLDLLCRPGFSTREEVTTTSGRGMGMDIVRRVVDQLGGELLVSTQVGKGTTFSLHVPLTIAIVDGFTTLCGDERFVIPVAMVEEILEVDPERVVSAPMTIPGGATQLGMFQRRGEAVPLIDLASLLQIRREGPAARRALVVRRGGQPIAFVLDRILGQQEVVVRPLVDPLVNVAGVSGATDLGDGRPTLVLDLVALAGARTIRMLRGGTRPLALPPASAPSPASPAMEGHRS